MTDEFGVAEAALAAGEPASIELPRVGLTLLPPWWCYVLWAGKRVENRAPSVAGRLRGWTGLIALTASKAADWEEVETLCRAVKEDLGAAYHWAGPKPFTLAMMRERGGHVVGVAEFLSVAPNGASPTDPWAVAGQHGLRFGRVAEVEPVPVIGGRGVFRFGACKGCGLPGACEGASLVCRACRMSTPRDELGRPRLKVKAVFRGSQQSPRWRSAECSGTADVAREPDGEAPMAAMRFALEGL